MTGEGGGRRLDSFNLEAELRRIAREEAVAAVRAALRDLPGSSPKLTTIAAHARRQGLGTSTLRRWARALGIRPEACGKYLTAELERAVARAGVPEAPAAEPPPADLATERARRAADAMRGRP